MNYDDFERALKYYEAETNYDQNYFPYLKDVQREWRTPSRQLAERLVEFLNKWRMRLKPSTELLDSLQDTVLRARPYLEALQEIKLEECDLHSVIDIGQERLKVQTASLYVFEMFYTMGNKFADVASAKVLHLLAPNFFVIWDNYTCFALTPDTRSFPWRYAVLFLPRVKDDIEYLISDTRRKFNLDRPQAIDKLRSLTKHKKTVVKLIDEYYWSRYTRRIFERKQK